MESLSLGAAFVALLQRIRKASVRHVTELMHDSSLHPGGLITLGMEDSSLIEPPQFAENCDSLMHNQ
jgi:hypothetical protein